ncbi:MAG: glycosyltransferase family 39 protein [Pseudomonadota bacterium]
MTHSHSSRRADGIPSLGLDLGLGLGAAVLLLLAVALSYLPGQSTVPPIDRDEPRYTQATKQMMETGDYVDIRFQEAPRHKKPIGIHWLQAGAAQVSGLGPDAPLWIYRLPSLFGALAALLLALWVARAFLPMPLALVAAALFSSMIIVGVEARLAKTDAVLLATILAAQGALARLWLSDARPLGMALFFWVALALGVLVKGPIAPMVCGLTIITLCFIDRRRLLSKLRPFAGLPLLAAICLPWYIAIYLSTDGAFFANALGRDFFGKATTGQEGHGAPPLTHFGFFLAVAWPLAPFAIAAIWQGVKARGPALTFAFAWVVPAWIVFELTPTKLPHYTLPMLAGVAIAAVTVLAEKGPPRWIRAISGGLILVGPLAVLAAAPILVMQLAGSGETTADLIDTNAMWTAVAILALALVAAGSAASVVWRGGHFLSARVVAPTVAAAVIAQAGVWGVALPALQPVWISTRLVETVRSVSPCEAPRLASVGGYNEPSMIFLSGTDTALVDPDEAVALARGGCVVIAARGDRAADVEEAARSADLTLRPAGVVEGFNISKGDPVRLTLFVSP